jgi:hypothetical protein
LVAIRGWRHHVFGIGAIPDDACSGIYLVAASKRRHAWAHFFDDAGNIHSRD